ncbi:MAG: hypothetical protein OHK0012_13230 [Synechococcales cyanobacterium]
MVLSLLRRVWGSLKPGILSSLCAAVLASACSSSSTTPFVANPTDVVFPNSDPDVTAVVQKVTNLLENPAASSAFALQVLHASDFEANARTPDDIRGFSAVISTLRNAFANTITLSSGDNYIPGAFYNASADATLADRYNRTPGKADIEILNALGIQAAALGNHEFDQGPRQVRDLILPDAGRGYAGTLFPYLSANLQFNNDPNGIRDSEIAADGSEASTIPNKIAKSAVITVNGQTIGIVGATTSRLEAISSIGEFIDVLGATTSDKVAASALQPTIDALIANGVNKVILLSHQQQIQNEYELASELTGVDIIIGGGSHRVQAKVGDSLRPGDTSFSPDYPILVKSASDEPVAVINTGANYTYVGRLLIGFNANGVITSFDERSGAYRTDTAGGTPIPEVVAAVQPIEALVQGKDGVFFGRTTLFLNGLRSFVRTRETNFGSLTADANLATAQAVDATTVLSLKNGGGIRAPLGTTSGGGGDAPVEYLPPAANPDTGKQEGQISQLDIESALAFNNTLSLVTINAEQLKLVLENAVSQVAAGATPGGFPQIAGLAFSFDPSQAAYTVTDGVITNPGSRVRNVCVKSNPPQVVVQNGAIVGDATRTFRAVTLNFLAGGGDNYPFPLFADTLDRVDLVPAGTPATFETEGTEQKALADFLTALGEVNETNYPDPEPTASKRIQNLGVAGVTDTIIADCQ